MYVFHLSFIYSFDKYGFTLYVRFTSFFIRFIYVVCTHHVRFIFCAGPWPTGSGIHVSLKTLY